MTYLDKLFSLLGKVVVVTGATRGLGQAIGEALLKAGATVILVGSNEQRLNETASAFTGEGLSAFGFRCDLADQQQIDGLVEYVAGQHQRIDVLVNNAGVTFPHELFDYPDESWRRTLQVNLEAPFQLSKRFAAMMKEQGGGSIVNITSIGAELGFPDNPAYIAAKGALKQLARSLALDLGPFRHPGEQHRAGLLQDRHDQRQLERPATEGSSHAPHHPRTLGTARRFGRSRHLPCLGRVALYYRSGSLRGRRLASERTLNMSKRVVYFNGHYVPESEARVSIFDSALMYGDMGFEMTRTFGGAPFKLREHIERLYATLRLLEIDCGLTIDEMERLTMETLERNVPSEPGDMDWWIMHDVSRGPLDLYRTAFPDGIRPTVTINTWPLITHMGRFAATYDTGVRFGIPAQQTLPAHLLDPKAKNRSRLHYRMAELQAKRMGEGIWPILLDPDGFLAEGPGWNIFLVKDGVLYTPEPRNILLGVTRATTIDLARDLGIPVIEANLGRYEALQADELFCTASSYCLVHGASFEGQAVGDGKSGPIFQKLLEAWKKLAGLDFVAQAHDYARRLPEWEQQQ